MDMLPRWGTNGAVAHDRGSGKTTSDAWSTSRERADKNHGHRKMFHGFLGRRRDPFSPMMPLCINDRLFLIVDA